MEQHLFQANVLHVRQILTRRGFLYCDGDDKLMTSQRQMYLAREHAAMRALQQYERRAESMRLVPVSATTTDHPTQGLAQTLDPDPETFWSSSGGTTTTDDALVYKVASGAGIARVHAVVLGVYRAQYQFGMPLYPPVALSIAVGASPTHLIPVLTRIPVAVCEAPQTFVLPADAPVGCFVRLTLHGRVQMQLEDSQYYTAVRHVMVLGHPLSYTATREAAQGAHATHPHKGLPATALRSIHPPRYTRCSCYKATTAQRIRSTYEVYRNDHHDMDYVYDDHGVGAHEEEGEEEGEEDAHMHDAQSTTSTTNPCTTCTTTTAAHDGSGTGTRSNIQSTNTRTPPPAALLTASQSQPQMGQNKYQSQVQKQQKQVEPMRVHVLAGDGYVVTHRRVGEGGGDGGHAHPGHTSRGGMFGGLLAKLGMG